MIKSVSLLTRKAGLSHEEFVKHWLEVHAPLAHTVPGLRRYVQSHIVKGFGRRRIATVRQALGPSSESPQGRNPRGVEARNMPPRPMAI